MLSVSDAFALARPAMFRIPIELESGNNWYWGTGFFVSPNGHALTAFHNLPRDVANRRQGHVDAVDKDENKFSLEYLPAEGDEARDIALLRGRSRAAKPKAYIPIAAPGKLSEAERIQFWAGRSVLIAGFPFYNRGQEEEGIAGHLRGDVPFGVEDEKNEDEVLVQIERLRIVPDRIKDLPGISGGPVLDLRTGMVVAVEGACSPEEDIHFKASETDERGLIFASELKSTIPVWEAAHYRHTKSLELIQIEFTSSVAPPFKGLESFQAEDVDIFFGLEEDTNELCRLVQERAFLAVVGASGSGKSSLVRAGLIPALTTESWRRVIVKPGAEDPFGALAEGLIAQLAGEERGKISAVRKHLSEGVDGLRNAIVELVSRGTSTLLVVDQFEELFTSTLSESERERYIDLLIKAASPGDDWPVHVLVVLRADFYRDCWSHPELPKLMEQNQFNVTRIQPDKFPEVIRKPLSRVGAQAEQELVDAILADIGKDPGELPLLQHALLKLWEEREWVTLTLAVCRT